MIRELTLALKVVLVECAGAENMSSLPEQKHEAGWRRGENVNARTTF